ncbi:hypothetical protein [Pseudomonas fluorescens]|uniref:Uncharacterized protein n=1 Tax=Pseudomonas fluorescens TaxID=294 RepID=A0A0F4TB01_PSEFL|nr:hypothetical protein [Pseudomonas fluorescens]KJZ41606.1 hypothetical protein VC34_17600 [Pseudomonas fluorescens]
MDRKSVEKDIEAQKSINLDLISAILAVWDAAAIQLKLNIKISTLLSKIEVNPEVRNSLIEDIEESKKGISNALDEIKKAHKEVIQNCSGEADDKH